MLSYDALLTEESNVLSGSYLLERKSLESVLDIVRRRLAKIDEDTAFHFSKYLHYVFDRYRKYSHSEYYFKNMSDPYHIQNASFGLLDYQDEDVKRKVPKSCYKNSDDIRPRVWQFALIQKDLENLIFDLEIDFEIYQRVLDQREIGDLRFTHLAMQITHEFLHLFFQERESLRRFVRYLFTDFSRIESNFLDMKNQDEFEKFLKSSKKLKYDMEMLVGDPEKSLERKKRLYKIHYAFLWGLNISDMWKERVSRILKIECGKFLGYLGDQDSEQMSVFIDAFLENPEWYQLKKDQMNAILLFVIADHFSDPARKISWWKSLKRIPDFSALMKSLSKNYAEFGDIAMTVNNFEFLDVLKEDYKKIEKALSRANSNAMGLLEIFRAYTPEQLEEKVEKFSIDNVTMTKAFKSYMSDCISIEKVKIFFDRYRGDKFLYLAWIFQELTRNKKFIMGGYLDEPMFEIITDEYFMDLIFRGQDGGENFLHILGKSVREREHLDSPADNFIDMLEKLLLDVNWHKDSEEIKFKEMWVKFLEKSSDHISPLDMTPLMEAARFGSLSRVKFFGEYGFVNTRPSSTMSTALIEAAKYNQSRDRLEILRYLNYSKKANEDWEDRDGKVAKDYLTSSELERYEEEWGPWDDDVD